MNYLLDVSTLIALLWKSHVHNDRVAKWETGLSLAVCPLTELGFLRISTQPVIGFTVEQARRALSEWKRTRKPAFVPCDMEALDMDAPPNGGLTTDFYLASLASRHGMQLATLDQELCHKAVFLIPT